MCANLSNNPMTFVWSVSNFSDMNFLTASLNWEGLKSSSTLFAKSLGYDVFNGSALFWNIWLLVPPFCFLNDGFLPPIAGREFLIVLLFAPPTCVIVVGVIDWITGAKVSKFANNFAAVNWTSAVDWYKLFWLFAKTVSGLGLFADV